MQGRTLGDFELHEPLGRGGSGIVYRAIQKSLGRAVVVKVLQGAPSSKAGERFLREARLASVLDHPFAAHVYGFGAEPDALWIAMELVRGIALDQLLKDQGPLPLARFVPFFERLCEVVQAVHDQGIVHRDIKPSNVMMLSRSGRLLPKLLDLGIARRSGYASRFDDDSPVEETEVELELTRSDSPDDMLSALPDSDTLAARLVGSETNSLTSAGVVVGTPHYMAPEQWLDASTAGIPADLYSLSLLAYQSLTGMPPFLSKSVRQVAKAHATQALPALPSPLPAALHAVLSKGAAKNPADRYSTAIELGAAVRAAANLEAEPFALPQLADDLRTHALAHAPQPIAEAVALVEAARTPREQLQGIAMLHRVCVRYLACLALACRGRVGSGGLDDDPSVIELVRAFSANSLELDQWRMLAQLLCRPFALKKKAYPLPELVTFFFDGNAAGPGARALSALAALGLPAEADPEASVHAALLKLVPATDALLQSLAFVFDYPLVIVRNNEAERWLGTRRMRRLSQPMFDTSAPAGVPLLVDALGHTVLVLSPLIQLMTPGALLNDELFMIEGAGRHGTRMVALPAPFERQSDEVWPWFAKHITDVSAVARGASEETDTPYKGLSAFTLEDADNYFGRAKEAETFANRLRATSSLLAVTGPSGSGKSSFVLAGVLPLMPAGWRHVIARPGADPFRALSASLAGMRLATDELQAERLLTKLQPGESLLLILDQFEELITLCPDPAVRESFARFLVELADDSSGRFRVVLTLRDDFLIKVQQLDALRARLSSGLQLLGSPARSDLLLVVTEPAKRLGYGFDDPALPARMVDEVLAYPGALALLSFTSSQLWAMRDRHLRQMRAKTYDALGGVGGALANHAESTLAEMTESETGLVREAFRHLVTSVGTRSVLSLTEMHDILGNSSAAHQVLEKLIRARLLVTFESDNQDDRVEIIHEALVTAWPRLAGWLREDAETARLRDTLRGSAKQWAERGRPSGLLWRKETLAEYRVWRNRFQGRLTQTEEAFAKASIREESRLRLLSRAAIVTVFVLLSAGLVTLYSSQQRAQANERLAVERAEEVKQRMRDLRIEQARLALLDDKPFQAMRYAQAGRALGATGTTIGTIESAIDQTLAGQREVVFLKGEQQLVASQGSTRIAVLDAKGALVVLSVPELMKVAELPGDQGRVASAAFLSEASGVLCQTTGGISRWREGSRPALLHTSAKPIVSCAYSAARKVLAVLLEGGRLQTWRLVTKPDDHLELVAELSLGQPYLKLLVSRSGEWLALYSRNPGAAGSSTVHVVRLRDNQVTSVLKTGDLNDTTADFSDLTEELAVGSYDATIRVFDFKSGVLRKHLKGHAADVTGLSHRADGAALLSTSVDGTARVWSSSGVASRTLLHRGPVASGFYLEDNSIATTLVGGDISLWDDLLTEPVVRFRGHASSPSVVALGTTRFASSAADGAVRLWELDGPIDPPRLMFPQGLSGVVPIEDRPLIGVGLDDGQLALMTLEPLTRVATRRNDDCVSISALAAGAMGSTPMVALGSSNVICLFEVDSSVTRTLRGHQAAVARLAFDPRGERLASSARDGSVFVWSLASGKRLFELHHPAGVRGITFSPDGLHLFAGLDDGQIYRYSAESGVRDLAVQAHGGFVRTLRFSGGRLLSASADQTAAAWSVDLKLERRFSGSADQLAWVDLTPGGDLLITSGFNGVIAFFDFQRGWPVLSFNPGAGTGDFWWRDGVLLTEYSNLGRVRELKVLGETGFRRECSNPLTLGDNGFVPRESFANCDQAGGRSR